MSVAQLVLEYFKVLVYPFVILILFFALKNQIKGLFNGINCLLEGKIVAKYGNASIELGSATEEIDKVTILSYIKEKGGILRLDAYSSEVGQSVHAKPDT